MSKKCEAELALLRSRQVARTEETRKRLRGFLVEGTVTGRATHSPGVVPKEARCR